MYSDKFHQDQKHTESTQINALMASKTLTRQFQRRTNNCYFGREQCRKYKIGNSPTCTNSDSILERSSHRSSNRGSQKNSIAIVTLQILQNIPTDISFNMVFSNRYLVDLNPVLDEDSPKLTEEMYAAITLCEVL